MCDNSICNSETSHITFCNIILEKAGLEELINLENNHDQVIWISKLEKQEPNKIESTNGKLNIKVLIIGFSDIKVDAMGLKNPIKDIFDTMRKYSTSPIRNLD